ncbi:hypothetical protein MRX96_025269 [Rhipicephalus microplus]
MVKEAAEPNGVPPKVGRAKRRAAPDQNAAGPSNEAAATKRPRGRPPKTSSEGPLAPTPHCTNASSEVAQGHGGDAARSRKPFCQQGSGRKSPENHPCEALSKLLLKKP